VVLDRRAPDDPSIDAELVDLADGNATRAAVDRLRGRCDGFDAVVTCAGVDVPGPFGQIPPDRWAHVIQVNLLGTANVVRASLPALQQRRGRVVTIASTLGHRVCGDATAYCASKWGVVGFTRALMAELKGSIGVTLLTPGGMATNFFEDRDPQYRPAPDTPLACADDIAEAVLFALTRPPGCELKELVVAGPHETSWP
jgi:NADP-dependent 3-hydroxy acid dehydrogenase YdfG